MVLDVDVVVFDQGNTLLLDPFPEVLKRQKEEFAKILEKYQGFKKFTEEEIKDAWTRVNNAVNYPFCGHFTQEPRLISETLKRLGIVITDSLIASFLDIYREGLRKVIEEGPRTQEVRNVLYELKYIRKRLGVFSNDRQDGLEMVLNFMNIKDMFEYVKTSEELEIEKPDARVFGHIASHFSDVPRERICYVGDVSSVDIDPAKRAGMKAVLYQVDTPAYRDVIWRDLRPGQTKPDATIKEFSELLDVII